MFTGIVEEVGTVIEITPGDGAREIRIRAPVVAGQSAPADSVAVDGACLTITAVDGEHFRVNAIASTLSRTIAAGYARGRRVNLERPLLVGARLGGHFVQGHVDEVGEVVAVARMGDYVLIDVHLPRVVAAVTILHGSITVNGVSLTINALPAGDRCQVAIIPFTWEHTNLSELEVGDPVNLEGDLIGKYVGKMLTTRGSDSGLSFENLVEWGY